MILKRQTTLDSPSKPVCPAASISSHVDVTQAIGSTTFFFYC